MKKLNIILLLAAAWLTSCNQEKEFPDFGTQSVYFAYQYPVRTITLGEDANVNTDLDNAYKCQIYAATGGVYSSKKDVSIGFVVDKSLLGNGLLFGAGKNQIMAMPENYYSFGSDNIMIRNGDLAGGVDVQLTDAFFADPKAIQNTYVIPLKMTTVNNADLILPNKSFVLYAVKYVNQYHGNYLRRGRDIITGAVNQTISRRNQYVEKDEVIKLPTRSLKEIEFPVVYKDAESKNINATLVLKFENDGNCTVSSATTGIEASGSGKFVKRGEKNSWGNKDRDAIYLNYSVKLQGMNVSTADTLVIRDRGVALETFTPVNK